MTKAVKYILLIIMVLFTGFFICSEYKTIWKDWCLAGRKYCLLVLPVLAFYMLFLSKRLLFFENLVHELTHLLFALLTFQKISNLYVSSTTGVVFTESTDKSTLVTTSPYFFPLLPMFLMCLFTWIEFRYSQHTVIVSYFLFLAVMIKTLIKEPSELVSTGIKGWLLWVILNFWTGFLILSWCLPD